MVLILCHPESLGGAVELAEQDVQYLDQPRRAKAARQLGKADQIGKDDADFLVHVGDPRLAAWMRRTMSAGSIECSSSSILRRERSISCRARNWARAFHSRQTIVTPPTNRVVPIIRRLM